MIILATFDEGYTVRKHTESGSKAQWDYNQGDSIHVFENVDFGLLMRQVWTQGVYTGAIRGWERFVWRSDVAIGCRKQIGKPNITLHYVEIKVDAQGSYHPVPRPRPANDKTRNAQ